MSRSYCKPKIPFHIKFKHLIDFRDGYAEDQFLKYWEENHSWVSKILDKEYKYSMKKRTSHYHSYRFPKSYRKEVNKTRRNHDKRELYKEVHFEEYEGLYSNWNCEDSDPRWYW